MTSMNHRGYLMLICTQKIKLMRNYGDTNGVTTVDYTDRHDVLHYKIIEDDSLRTPDTHNK